MKQILSATSTSVSCSVQYYEMFLFFLSTKCLLNIHVRFTPFPGIWGVSIGNREYALLCSTWGFEIIDVTDPSSPFKVQAVEMTGGLYWRDVATHTTASGKVYAYVAAQDVFDSGADLYVFDLSNLSGDQNNPNGKGSNPIPTSGYVNLGNSGEQ